MARRDVASLSAIAENSFLRAADPRTKIALAFAVSAAAALPLPALALVGVCLAGLLATGRLARRVAAQLWRARVWFCILFVLDWIFVGFAFAVLIALRLTVLAASCTVVFATTTADELCLAGEHLGLSRRLAFALATAFRSLGLVEREWREIIEAQQARGITVALVATPGWRGWRERFGAAAALVVPAIVLAVQRAWALSEAAAVRGFESPLRRPYRVLRFQPLDHALLAAMALVLGGSLFWR
jgi:energy-coupling factor transporter transmembrane protein EcfT